MAHLVRACPNCERLMWVKEEDAHYLDENTIRTTCPHCHQSVRFKLITQGSNAAGPKMGH
jgi:RNase P subunit RPR2